jgi:ferrous iron transport protein B
MLAGLSWKVSLLWFLSIAGSLFLVGSLSGKMIPGKRSPFMLEIPPLRWPAVSNILIKIRMRLTWYLKEAVPLFALGTLILFTLDKLHVLAGIEHLLKPVVSGFLGLPEKVTQSFILGFLRRDYGAAGLFMLAKQGELSARQVFVSTLAITLFMPCIAQCFIVIKEQGWKIGVLIFTFVSLYALLFSGLMNYLVLATGIF